MSASKPDFFTEPVRALQNLIEKLKDQGVIIGGIAASILGRPRFTNDLDAVFLLSTEDIDAFIQAAATEQILT